MRNAPVVDAAQDLSCVWLKQYFLVIRPEIEIDEAAAEQAKENFASSSWKKRLNVYHTSIQQFANSPMHGPDYDVIISNPPFFENDLRSVDAKKNLALHSDELKLEELINIAEFLLNDKGSFFVLIPYHRSAYFIQLIQQKFFIKEKKRLLYHVVGYKMKPFYPFCSVVCF